MRNAGKAFFDRIKGSLRSNHVVPVILSKILLLLLIGCSSTKRSVPEWVVNPQEVYAPSKYLVAVGEGDTRRAAENSAAAGLARIFESRIEATETLSETVQETGTALDRASELNTHVQIGSGQELINVQYGEAFTGRDGRVHVAALIPRAETGEILRGRIAENSAEILRQVRRADQTAEPLDAYAFRRAAVRRALENERLLAQLDIIAPGAQPPLSYRPDVLYAETAAAARNVAFAVRVPGEAGNALREALTGMGFREAEPAVLTFSGGAAIEPIDLQREPLVFVRTRVQIEARDAAGRLILSMSEQSREGHINRNQAFDRARSSLRSQILKQIPLKLGRTLDRLAAAGP